MHLNLVVGSEKNIWPTSMVTKNHKNTEILETSNFDREHHVETKPVDDIWWFLIFQVISADYALSIEVMIVV